ncbi:MAG TPA: FkbM family methyltransferase [Candidatus Polarisedimenticolia bacterium]|nr:FkbM family methyltransferase [Candidatus Polarisedimenticolia bacterium]
MSFAARTASGILRRGLLPVLPMRFRLPIRYRLHLTEDSCEQELRFLDRIINKREIGIDVGANDGLYSYNMSRLFKRVYSFEVNEALTKELEAYNPGNIETITKGLSSKAGSAVLHIPMLHGRPLTGWGSLSLEDLPATEKRLTKEVEICTLDSLNIKPVSFIKIDVEGHEMEVLRGAAQTLKRDRPRVLIEIRPRNLDEVYSYFADLGYRRKALEDLIGVTGSEQNHIFVPAEQLQQTSRGPSS